ASFATLRARIDVPSHRIVPASVAAMLGPVVVVTGRLTPDDLPPLRAAAQRSALPVLIAVSEDAIEGTGWHASSVHPGGDVARAWDEAARP
ncbi:hypothetical protein, partial [Enterococcus faecium]